MKKLENQEFYLISSEFNLEKYRSILDAIKKNVVSQYIDDSNDEYISFIFLGEDGEKVMSELLKNYKSNSHFFSDLYPYEEMVENFGVKLEIFI
jgi:hypothetical protein|nr:MAG TPA: hypothetical protein [Caudoviricetes sp.]